MKEVFILFLVIFVSLQKQDCRQERCKDSPSEVIHIQMGAHSHLDAFWLQTYEEYLTGSGHDHVHQWVNVKRLYSGVLEALQKDPRRTYQMAEVCYIKPWYQGLSNDDQKAFKKMLLNGQIEILNGGWVQNDEALPFYDDIIDQLTIGHLYLQQTFNITTSVAFNVDNFGHSMTQAAIYSQMGFKAQIIARLDTEDIKERTKTGTLEFIWEPTPSTGVFKDKLLTQIRFKRHGPWQWHDTKVKDYDCDRLEQMFIPFEDQMHEARKAYSSNEIYHYAGDDFQFFNDDRFQSLQAMIDFYEDLPCKGIEIHFSTPSLYFQNLVKLRESQTKFKWTKKHTDFFPYWEDGLYWTGFFTSSPDYKIKFRDASRYLQSFRKLLTSAILNQFVSEANFLVINNGLNLLQEEVSLAQHHDGITSTSKYGVMDNVVGRITEAWKQLEIMELKMVQKIIEHQLIVKPTFLGNKHKLVQCSLSINQDSQNLCNLQLTNNVEVLLSIYNSQSEHQYQLQLFNSVSTTLTPPELIFELSDVGGNILEGEIICDLGHCKLLSMLNLKAYQMQYFKLKKISQTKSSYTIFQHEQIKFQNKFFQIIEKNADKNKPSLKFLVMEDRQTFQIQQIYESTGESEVYEFKISLEKYIGVQSQQWSNWDNHYFNAQCGKYVMMNDNERTQLSNVTRITSVNTNQTIEIKMYWEDLAVTTLTINKKSLKPQVDLSTKWDGEHLFNQWGDFVLVLKETSIKKQDFFVDSNGLTMMQRKQQWREDFKPVYNQSDRVPGNYYPMTAISYIQDKSFDFIFKIEKRMSVFTDRAQGVASFNDGEIEINIDRLAGEDGRGVGEWLSKKTQHTFKHRITFETLKDTEKSIFVPFHQWDDKNLIYLLPFSNELSQNLTQTKQIQLNENYRVTSFPIDSKKFLIRIQNVDETSSHKINLFKFKNFEVFRSLGSLSKNYKVLAEEKTLNGVTNIQQSYQERWYKEDEKIKFTNITIDSLEIIPRQIRTFMVQLLNTTEKTTQESLEEIEAEQMFLKKLESSTNENLDDIIIDQDGERQTDRDALIQTIFSGSRPELSCVMISQLLYINALFCSIMFM